MSNEFDFIAIGDVVTDEFIQLKQDKACIDEVNGKELLAMNFGDKLEYEGAVNVAAVGNSPNASVGAHRLGLKSALVCHVGNDEGGEEIIKQLKHQGVDQSFVQVQDGHTTNHHYVLRYGAERTILIKHAQFEYKLPDIGKPKYIYFSSVAENSLPYHHEIAAFVKENPEVKLAFQPGSFQIKLGYETLKDIYEASEIFFCNKEEAQRILDKKGEEDIQELLKGMRDLGPTIVIITDGPDGAYTYDGEEMWHMPMYPDPSPPVDRTGAGDSFSSTFTSALALGHDIPTALSWGPINSMSVVQYIGAQEGLLSREKLLEHLENAPEDYKPSKVN